MHKTVPTDAPGTVFGVADNLRPQFCGLCLVESSSAFLAVEISVICADLAMAMSNVSCMLAMASVAGPFNPPLAAQSKFHTPDRLSAPATSWVSMAVNTSGCFSMYLAASETFAGTLPEALLASCDSSCLVMADLPVWRM